MVGLGRHVRSAIQIPNCSQGGGYSSQDGGPFSEDASRTIPFLCLILVLIFLFYFESFTSKIVKFHLLLRLLPNSCWKISRAAVLWLIWKRSCFHPFKKKNQIWYKSQIFGIGDIPEVSNHLCVDPSTLNRRLPLRGLHNSRAIHVMYRQGCDDPNLVDSAAKKKQKKTQQHMILLALKKWENIFFFCHFQSFDLNFSSFLPFITFSEAKTKERLRDVFVECLLHGTCYRQNAVKEGCLES